MNRGFILVLVSVAIVSRTVAALEPVAPVGGAVVQLVPDAQKQVMSCPTQKERIKMLVTDRNKGKVLAQDEFWRKAKPFVFEIRVTEGENGPWKVLIGKRADLSDARTWYVSSARPDKATGRECAVAQTQDVVRIEVPMANLEIATRYYWKVVWRGRCGFGCKLKHGCKPSRRFAETAVSEFVTEDFAPRWIELEGKVDNVRDLGGRIGLGGKRVRQGMIYRGQGLNGNSVTGEERGRNRLTVEDVNYLTGTLGIRTDLDLRGEGEVAGMHASPLGESVKFIWRSSSCYRGIFKENGKKSMAVDFRVFCDRANYPIYFHCIGGADRTGALAYVLNGILGVSRQELETDWESTFYPRIPDESRDPAFWCRVSHLTAGFSKYGDADTPWGDRIVLYLKDCGITDNEITAFREIMLVDK